MTLPTLKFPNESVRCQRGDYILQQDSSGRIGVYWVEDVVKLSRLVPWGEDALIEEQIILDSERPAFMDEIHVLLSVFDRDFASLDEATRAVEASNLGPAIGGRCLNIRRFPMSNSRVYRPAAPGDIEQSC